MFTEKKKMALIITLTVTAFLLLMIGVLGFILDKEASDSYNRFLYEIRFIFWGWLLALVLAATAIGATLYWKPSKALFRGFMVFLSMIAIIWALLCLFGLIMISTMKF